jgi:hypothetical protein
MVLWTKRSGGSCHIVVRCSDIFETIKEPIELDVNIWRGRPNYCPFLQ